MIRALFFSVAPDWPQTVIQYVQVRHEEEHYWEANTALEQAAWRSCWIFHLWRSWRLSKTKPCLTFSRVDDSPALSRRLDCMTSRSPSQQLQNLNWLGFCSSFIPFLLLPRSKMTVAHMFIWKNKQHCQKTYPTHSKAFANDSHKTLLLFLRENNNTKKIPSTDSIWKPSYFSLLKKTELIKKCFGFFHGT